MKILSPITDPTFLLLYVGLLIVAIVLRKPIKKHLLSRARPTTAPSPLKDDELAYLARGKTGAMEVALIQLFTKGLVQLQRPLTGLVASRNDPFQPEGPLEIELRRSLNPSLPSRMRIVGDHAFKDIISRLQAQNLLLAPQTPEYRTAATLSQLPLLLLIFWGVIQALHQPESTLIFAGLIAVSVFFIVWWIRQDLGKPELTLAGQQLIAKARGRNAGLEVAALRRGHELSFRDLSLGVALFGIHILAHSTLSPLHQCLLAHPQDDVRPRGSGHDGHGYFARKKRANDESAADEGISSFADCSSLGGNFGGSSDDGGSSGCSGGCGERD